MAGRAATGAGFVFSLANIGFDIYNLSIAENHEQRSRFSTSLAFNVAALGLDIVALAAGGVVGGAAAFLSVPLLGIGIGVTAIASNLGQIRDKATAVGNHLRDIQNAYTPGAYTLEHGVLQFPAEAVITSLDLQDNQVRFNSQSFYPWVGSWSELPQSTSAPEHMHRAINIREAFELPEVMTLDKGRAGDRHTVVLPCTPVCFYGYEYQLGGTGHKYVPKPGEVVAPRTSSEAPGRIGIHTVRLLLWPLKRLSTASTMASIPAIPSYATVRLTSWSMTNKVTNVLPVQHSIAETHPLQTATGP